MLFRQLLHIWPGPKLDPAFILLDLVGLSPSVSNAIQIIDHDAAIHVTSFIWLLFLLVLDGDFLFLFILGFYSISLTAISSRRGRSSSWRLFFHFKLKLYLNIN